MLRKCPTSLGFLACPRNTRSIPRQLHCPELPAERHKSFTNELCRVGRDKSFFPECSGSKIPSESQTVISFTRGSTADPLRHPVDMQDTDLFFGGGGLGHLGDFLVLGQHLKGLLRGGGSLRCASQWAPQCAFQWAP